MRRRSFGIAFTPAIQARARKAQLRAGCAAFSNRVGSSFDGAALGMDKQNLIIARDGFCLPKLSETGSHYFQFPKDLPGLCGRQACPKWVGRLHASL